MKSKKSTIVSTTDRECTPSNLLNAQVPQAIPPRGYMKDQPAEEQTMLGLCYCEENNIGGNYEINKATILSLLLRVLE